ncbi:MAG: 6-phosphofructokinase, partial [Clostridia bacterium 62_21]
HSVIVVAEGAASGLEVGREIKARTGFDTKVTILGHIQRGGTPTAFDRVLASRLGARAIELLIAGQPKKAVGMTAGRIVDYEFDQAFTLTREVDLEMYRLASILSI